MSNVGPEKRSFEPIEQADLERLAQLAQSDLDSFFKRHPRWAREYQDRLLALTLCQGAASHFLGRGRGIQDFDVWAFFRADAEQRADQTRWFPPRRRGKVDFGPSRFGRNPDDKGFTGRRVDVIGRGIPASPSDDSATSIREYLRSGRAKSPRLLAQAPVVILHPKEDMGRVVWDPARDQSR